MANTAPDISALVSALPAGTIPAQYAPLLQLLGSMLKEEDEPENPPIARQLRQLRRHVRAQQQTLERARRTIRAYRGQNRLLARAHGACECWGGNPECETCGGQGGARWTTPDEALLRDLFGYEATAPSRGGAEMDEQPNKEQQVQERGSDGLR